MASSSTESAGKTRHVVIEPYKILNDAPENRQVKWLEVGEDKNKWLYPILVYFDNDEQTFNGKQKVVCYYNHQWCALGYNKEFNKLLAVKPLPEVHQYDNMSKIHYYSDIPLSTHHYSDNKPERGVMNLGVPGEGAADARK